MFTKLKAAWLSLMARIAHRMYEMSIEQEAANALKVAVADVEAVFAKVETALEPAIAKVEAIVQPVVVQVQAQAAPVVSQAAAVVASDLDVVLGKVNDLLTLADRAAPTFATIAALAKASVGTTDLDTVLVKLKALLAYAGVKVDVWDEIVSVAKLI